MNLLDKKCEHCGLIAESVECKFAEECDLVTRPCNLCLNCQLQVELGKIECPPKLLSGWG